MTLFSDDEMERIRQVMGGGANNVLITFRNEHGPTRLVRLFEQMVGEFGAVARCTHWWSGAGNLGLLECELDGGKTVFGQWALGDRTELINVLEVEGDEVVHIKDGFDAGNVASSAMRAIRIGETGDRD